MPLDWKHSLGGVLRKALVRRTKPDHWRAARAVRRGMQIPQRSLRMGGREVWAIMMVKNEQDLIESTVSHIFDQGFDCLLIVDNLSTDDTPRILERLAKAYPITLGKDQEPAYYQSEKMTYLARWASRHGAGWVVPMDADEFWFAEQTSVATFLRHTPYDIIEAPIHNLFPLPENPEPRSLRSGRLRFDFKEHKLPKVALRASQLAWLGMGNHWGHRPGLTGPGLHVAHLPWRSEAQLKRKLRQGAEALAKTNLDKNLGNHWRRGGALTDAELDAHWDALLAGESNDLLGWSPEGPFTVTDPEQWSAGTWPSHLKPEMPTDER